MLGFYMSSHPLARHAGLLQALATHRVADLAVAAGEDRGRPGRHDHQRQGTKRAEEPVGPDADGEAHLRGPERHRPRRCSGPRSSPRWRELVKNDLIGFVKGTLDRRRDPAELVISRIIPLEQGPAELTRGVVVRLHKGVHQTEHLERLLRADPSPARQPRPLPRDRRPGTRPTGNLPGRRITLRPLRRSARYPTWKPSLELATFASRSERSDGKNRRRRCALSR